MFQNPPAVGGAFQDALLKTTKATSENQSQQMPNKTATVDAHPASQTSNSGPAPEKPSNVQSQQSPASAQPQKEAAQEPVKPATQPPQNTVGHQQDVKPLTGVSQKAPVQPPVTQVANLNHQTADGKPIPPTVNNGQPAKVVAPQQQQQANKPAPVVQHLASPPVQLQGPAAQPQIAAQPKPAISNLVPPTQRKPTIPVVHAPTKQQPQQATVPTHKPTAAVTSKTNRFGAQLATMTRPENIHHVLQATGPLHKPTLTPAAKFHQTAVVQHFPTRGKYRDEE